VGAGDLGWRGGGIGSGHAAAEPAGQGAAVVADALHLLAASVWGGGLLLIAAVLLPALRPLAGEQRRAALRAAIPRFSIMGIAAWAVLLLIQIFVRLRVQFRCPLHRLLGFGVASGGE